MDLDLGFEGLEAQAGARQDALAVTASVGAAVRAPDQHAFQLGVTVEVLRHDAYFGLTDAIVEIDSFEGGDHDGALAYKLSCGGWFARDELKVLAP